MTHRGGSRSIRIRQREQRAARRTATAEPTVAASTVAAPTAGTGHPGQDRPASAGQAVTGPGRRGPGQHSRTAVTGPGCSGTFSRCPGPDDRGTGIGPARSPELRALQATVANSRQSGNDRRGLGSAPRRQPVSAQGARYVQALSAAKPQDMDCCPPIVLPPLRQADSMDTDDPEPQPLVSAAQPIDISAPPQLSESVRDELMHWMDAHTNFCLRKKPYVSAELANCSNINRQI